MKYFISWQEINKVAKIFLFIVRRPLANQAKSLLFKMAALIRTKLIDMNIFPRCAFGSSFNEATVLQLGRWATRLYLVLLTFACFIVACYTVVRPQVLNIVIYKPSLNQYQHLLNKHGSLLKCPCSSIASTYEKHIKIEPIFHQVKEQRQNNVRSRIDTNNTNQYTWAILN